MTRPAPLVVPGASYRYSFDQTDDALARLASAPVYAHGRPTDIVSDSGYIARFGELVRCDPSRGSFTLQLPIIEPGQVGQSITFANVTSSANAITILPFSGTINGANLYSVGKSYFFRTLKAIDSMSQLWIDETADIGAGGASVATPIWEWNGSDLTQFKAEQDGARVTSSTWDIASAHGLNWIRAQIATSSGSALSGETAMAEGGSFLAIDTTLPGADYALVAEFKYESLLGGNGTAAGVFVRLNLASEKGYGCARVSNSSSSTSFAFGYIQNTGHPNPEFNARYVGADQPNLIQESGARYGGGIVGLEVQGQMTRGLIPGGFVVTRSTNTYGSDETSAAGEAALCASCCAANGSTTVLFRNVRLYNVDAPGIIS